MTADLATTIAMLCAALLAGPLLVMLAMLAIQWHRTAEILSRNRRATRNKVAFEYARGVLSRHQKNQRGA